MSIEADLTPEWLADVAVVRAGSDRELRAAKRAFLHYCRRVREVAPNEGAEMVAECGAVAEIVVEWLATVPADLLPMMADSIESAIRKTVLAKIDGVGVGVLRRGLHAKTDAQFSPYDGPEGA